MKKLVFTFAVLICLIALNNVLAADICDIDVSLLNQDPYPAVPGDSLKVVFQVDGIASSECGDIRIELVEEFPFSIDPSSNSIYEIKSGTYTKDYNSAFMAPFKVRIDEDALNGETPIKIKYNNVERMFNVEIRDIRANFEIFVEDYDLATETISFEILNIGSEDIEAVTLEVPTQEMIQIYGATRENVGDLSSNEATTSDFKISSEKNKIDLIIHYSDITNTRRTIEQTINLNLGNFTLLSDKNNFSFLWILLIVILILGFIFYKKKCRKNKKV